MRRRLPLKLKFKPRRRLRRNKAAQREILKIEVFQDIRINENEQFGRPNPPPRGGVNQFCFETVNIWLDKIFGRGCSGHGRFVKFRVTVVFAQVMPRLYFRV